MNPGADQRFSDEILPHLDAAYALARWLTRNDHDAEDVVQEALVKAMRCIQSFQGLNARGWLLAIVRTTAYDWLRKHRSEDLVPMADDEGQLPSPVMVSPDAALIHGERRQQVRQLLERLPIQSREVLLLREVEGLPYKAIAEIIGSPIGTVMSRLARAREQLSVLLATVVHDV